jgi:hypothetical protein
MSGKTVRQNDKESLGFEGRKMFTIKLELNEGEANLLKSILSTVSVQGSEGMRRFIMLEQKILEAIENPEAENGNS